MIKEIRPLKSKLSALFTVQERQIQNIRRQKLQNILLNRELRQQNIRLQIQMSFRLSFQRLYPKMMQSMFLQTIQLQRIQELLMQLQDLLKSLFLQAKRVSQRAAVLLPLQSAIMISDIQQAKWLPIFFVTEQILLKWKSDMLEIHKKYNAEICKELGINVQPIMLLLTQQHNCFKYNKQRAISCSYRSFHGGSGFYGVIFCFNTRCSSTRYYMGYNGYRRLYHLQNS